MSIATPNRLFKVLKDHLFPIAAVITAAVLQALGEHAIAQLRYEREAIFDGEIWRLLTGHLVHLGWRHLALNAIGLWLIWLLFRQEWSQRQWLWLWLLVGLGVSIGQLLFDPQVVWVVGLSGTLHGLFALGAIAALRHGERSAAIMLLALIAKLLWEQFASPMPGSEQWIGGAVLTSAHLYGAVTGAMLAALLPRPWWPWSKQPKHP